MQPERTCVACRGRAGKAGLLRFRRAPDGRVDVDPAAQAPGRGAYLHRDPACLELARRRRSLERALRAQVADGFWEEVADRLSDQGSGLRA